MVALQVHLHVQLSLIINPQIYLQTSWVVTDSAALFCMPANIDGEMVYTDDGDELPPGSVPLNNIKANSILYCGFLIPLGK